MQQSDFDHTVSLRQAYPELHERVPGGVVPAAKMLVALAPQAA
jgi:hypothetical protein